MVGTSLDCIRVERGAGSDEKAVELTQWSSTF